MTNTNRRKFWTVQRWTDKLILRERFVSPRYQQTRLNKDSRWQVRLYQKSYIISVISPPVDYQASSRLTQWVVTWKESDILPLCFVSAPRASMFTPGRSWRHYGLSLISLQFLFSIQNVPSIWKYIILLNVIQDLVNKVNRQHLLFLNVINIM